MASEKIIHPSNPSTVMRSSVLAATLALTLLAQSYAVDPASGKCTGTVEHEWLDILFVVDSSKAMTRGGLINVRAFIQSALFGLSLGTGHEQSRVGIISYAQDVTIDYGLNITNQDLLGIDIGFKGDEGTNLAGAIDTAVSLFGNNPDDRSAKKVIVVVASAYRNGDYKDPNQIAAEFREDGGVLVTIEYKQPHAAEVPMLNEIASEGYSFTNNDGDFSSYDMLVALTYANCFCAPSQHPLSNNPFLSPDLGCLDEVNFPSIFPAAKVDCETKKSSLIKIDSEELQNAVTALFNVGQKFWIGLTKEDGADDFTWVADSSALGDYKPWADSEPKADANCVYSLDGQWYADDCIRANLDYACASEPCTTDYDCLHTEGSTSTSASTDSTTSWTTDSSTSATTDSSSSSTTSASTTTTSEPNEE